jgi:two-component system response regulator MprA
MRILIADDEQVLRRYVRRLLEAQGHVVEEAANGEEVLARLGAPGPLPDALLLDMEMPVLGGLETLRRLRAELATAELPVVVLSGRHRWPEPSDDVSRLPPLLRKPFEPMELVEQIERVAFGRAGPFRLPATG